MCTHQIGKSLRFKVDMLLRFGMSMMSTMITSRKRKALTYVYSRKLGNTVMVLASYFTSSLSKPTRRNTASRSTATRLSVLNNPRRVSQTCTQPASNWSTISLPSKIANKITSSTQHDKHRKLPPLTHTPTHFPCEYLNAHPQPHNAATIQPNTFHRVTVH